MFWLVMSSMVYAIAGMFFVLPIASAAAQQSGSTSAPKCQIAGTLVRVSDLPEGSGIAASKRSPGRFWSHNDSGEPVLVALDSKGTVLGRVRVSNAKVEDWEAIAVGACPAGSCIYVGDIGDNDAERREITVYRIPEPADASGSVSGAEVFRGRYPDGAHDAETLVVTPKGGILIVTKGETGHIALYRFPPNAKPGETVTFELVGKPRSGKAARAERITDGSVSPGGTWVALRTLAAVTFYRTADLLAGNWREASRVSLESLGEPQGEGIAFADESSIYLVSEGGGKSQPGTFGRLTCAL
jgi:hypothetical protein